MVGLTVCLKQLTSYTECVLVYFLELANQMWMSVFFAHRNIQSSASQYLFICSKSTTSCTLPFQRWDRYFFLTVIQQLAVVAYFIWLSRANLHNNISCISKHTHPWCYSKLGVFVTWVWMDSHRGHDFACVMLTLWDSVSLCIVLLYYWICHLVGVVCMCMFNTFSTCLWHRSVCVCVCVRGHLISNYLRSLICWPCCCVIRI